MADYDKEEIEKLREQILFVAKVLASELSRIEYNLVLFLLKGDAYKKFTDEWKKKCEAVLDDIQHSTTVEQAIDISDAFRRELDEYITATKVETASKAMDIAHSFIKKYSPVALPLKAVKENDTWLVDIDVGALAVKVAKVKIDARTGDILSYEIPEK